MKQNPSRTTFLIGAIVFLALTYLPMLASERVLNAFVLEDQIFETLTAVYLLATSVVFAIIFFRFKKVSWLMKLSLLGLALLFFVGAGEEVSWGERIFRWNDHNYIRSMNVQGELTIHNLKYFQGEDAVIPISTSQLLLAFAVVFTLVIPLARRFVPTIRNFLNPIFPIMPLDLGLLSVANYIFQKAVLRILPHFPALYHHSSMPIPQGVYEIREHGFTLGMLISAIAYYLIQLNANRAEEKRSSLENLTSSSSSMLPSAEVKGGKA